MMKDSILFNGELFGSKSDHVWVNDECFFDGAACYKTEISYFS